MAHSAFQFAGCTPVAPGQLRLTRLNIYSGLYLEWAAARIVVDPAKVIQDLVWRFAPDLILVSHESMDHFDPEVCLHWLQNPTASMVASWGTIAALAGLLSKDDARWKRIYAAVPGATFVFGDISIHVHASLHCEYASPVFFEIAESKSGWRLIDLIDTALTPAMQTGQIAQGCDLAIVPLGIALGASADTAWKLVETLKPRAVMPGHFNGDPSRFAALAQSEYKAEDVHICSWHQGVTLENAGSPVFAASPILPEYVTNLTAPATTDAVAQGLEPLADEPALANALYATTWATLLHGGTDLSEEKLSQLNEHCLNRVGETTTAAYLLALGATLAKSTQSHAAMLDMLLLRLDPSQPYLGYWLVECCGRAAENPADQEMVAAALDRIAADKTLFASEPIRRKYMWEVFRLVELGGRRAGLNTILWKTFADPNPDVRLLAFKTLPLCTDDVEGWKDLLAQGCNDPHEDVLEWVVNAYIDLLSRFNSEDFAALEKQLPKFLTHSNYHVRQRANVLTEMTMGGGHGRTARA